ncbi:hypothetical protein CDL15_Pgr029216 [Punica granatum]|uniref:Uncharacterized protein n=1 Tax=Punica granatum TaxID=22663 RepID=A0A218XCA9_PUNGR|nr:hypothetical protein CDL15_Pgr029216 [Punica granatum]
MDLRGARRVARRVCKVRGVLPGGLHGAGKSSRDVPEGDGPLSRKDGSKAPTRWTCEMHERLLGEFAICTGRIPNEQHGSKAPTQWTCGVRGVLPGGFARCGVFCSRDGPLCRKVVGTYPKGTDP